MDLLDRIAAVLAVGVSELFVVPAPGEPAPAPLRGGRRRKLVNPR